MNRKLRVGVLLDSYTLPAPMAEALAQVARAEFCELALVVTHATVAVQRGVNRSRSGRRPEPGSRLRNLVYRLYCRWDSWRHPQLAKCHLHDDCRDFLNDVPTLHMDWANGRAAVSEQDLQRLREHDLDVLLNFGPASRARALIGGARYGVWTQHYGDPERYRGGPAYFWETVDSTPLCELALVAHVEGRNSDLVLAQGVCVTQSNMSVAKNSVAPLTIGKSLLIRKLQQLHTYGWDFLLGTVKHKVRFAGVKRDLPTNIQMGRFLLGRAVRQLHHRARRRGRIEFWNVGLRVNPAGPSLDSASNPAQYKWVLAPQGHYYADPFLIQKDGKTFAFFEDYDMTTGKGSIACAQVSDDGTMSEAFTVISEPHHLSYPFVFEADGAVYMIPESGTAAVVCLYRAVEFPSVWKLERVLFEGHAFDTTPLRANGRWWFFTTILDPPDVYSPQLYLFHARSLHDEWEMHPASPISLDVRTARCAGAPFRHNGHWVRVAQDGAPEYGSRVRFQQITKLTESEYKEEPLVILQPAPEQPFEGIHTYNRCGHLEAIDGRMDRVPERVDELHRDPAGDEVGKPVPVG